MSVAGVRSNRGDVYQTLVAFDWALTLLTDSNYCWLEIDSVNHAVDDVVVGTADGRTIAMQCKKNQVDFKAWSISDLDEELEKAIQLLAGDSGVEVRFYSRTNFGDIAKLKEHAATQQDEAGYQASLGARLLAVDQTLSSLLRRSMPVLSVYEFLRRTHFVCSEEFDRMETLLRERLRNLVSRPDLAFDAIWARLDRLGARLNRSATAAVQHRLTKSELMQTIHQAGVLLAPPMDVTEIRTSFSGTSAIGRSWRRDVGGQRIPNPVVGELLAAIDAGEKAILLTGLPGAGKTCAMLELQDLLEARVGSGAHIVPLFIQSREFADCGTAQERHAQGLPDLWVERAARAAENARVVVVIDSLDVLSIAREHGVLSYFLAQVDRLLLIDNVVVVTACRDFDRHYDRRIRARQWSRVLTCEPLSWDAEIAPLLESQGISTVGIDVATRELIRNPRELALFVELALQQGSFNVVTGLALAQRYLDNIVRTNDSLGEAAVEAIETMASDMLKSRSLVLPAQRFRASHAVRRELCSLNVLQETQNGALTFGHQTLLDVLVISGAVRAGVSLNEFIRNLPPVPFVRPSIRSFVAHLALGARREFRKQIRTVLTSTESFHIRRLVAESFAEQLPLDEDWSLVRDLREHHRDIFLVIYSAGSGLEWHHFWLRHLVPLLKSTLDGDGLSAHVQTVAQWINVDSAGVLSFWEEVLELDYMSEYSLVDRIGFFLSQMATENLMWAAPLLGRLLQLPQTEHSMLGPTLARCVDVGAADDAMVWRYITATLTEADLEKYSFDRKLRCYPHEFGNSDQDFLRQRMAQSPQLLELAVSSLERWSDLRAPIYGEQVDRYRDGFLRDTSFDVAHSEIGMHPLESLNLLLNAIEGAILHHATTHSSWWQSQRERLCFNREGALLYFAVLACTAAPESNRKLIGRMLCDHDLLASDLGYEVGNLIHAGFVHLDDPVQDQIQARILPLWRDRDADGGESSRLQKARAELLVAIPCHLRAPEAQALVETHERRAGALIRAPKIYSHGGVVGAPFSFGVFLTMSDAGVLALLAHYDGHSNWDATGGEFLIGGEREVGAQLQAACSRNPSRFLRMLSNCWTDIPEQFRDDMLYGVAVYLAHKHGHLQANGEWLPVEEPNSVWLAGQILDHLQDHPLFWHHKRTAAHALEACANVICDVSEVERLTLLAISFSTLREAFPLSGDRVDHVTQGINMAGGKIAEALMIVANNLAKHQIPLPALLSATLRRFASLDSRAINALILRRLPYFQNKMRDLGWELFDLAMNNADGLWETAEPCLYYAYHNNFELVEPLLARVRLEGQGKELEVFGRISALAALTGHIDPSRLVSDLQALGNIAAWEGAASVWAHAENMLRHRKQCLAGLHAGLSADGCHASAVAAKMESLFRCEHAQVPISLELIQRCFAIFGQDTKGRNNRLYGFHEWLSAAAQHNPELALGAAEAYVTYLSASKPFMYDYDNQLPQLLTRLFAEAEEREESDGGIMLQRVVTMQDTLLSLGLDGVAKWLQAAERP